MKKLKFQLLMFAFVSALVIRSFGQCTPPPTNIISWWPGNGSADDVVGADAGVLVGGLSFATGEIGQAFEFTETNGYVFVPASSRLNVGADGGFTVEEWISPANISAPMPIFVWGTNLISRTNSVIDKSILAGPILNTNNGHFYYLLETNTWTNSQIIAQKLGGNLATIRSAGENNWISNTFANFGGVPRSLWIGLYDPSQDTNGGHAGNFVWVDGEPVTYLNWGGGQPDNCSGTEYYVHIFSSVYGPGNYGGWNDMDNWGVICNSGGSLSINGIVEVSSPDVEPYLWTSIGTSGCLYANLLDSTNGSHIIESAAGLIQSNVYQHIAWTYDGASGMSTLYLNGSVVASSNLGIFQPNTTGDVYLGERNDGASRNIFSGGMDEVAVYGRALSSAEILSIYQAGVAGKCQYPASPYILGQPSWLTNVFGTTAQFTVQANGSRPLYYQWRFDGTNIAMATNSTLTLANLTTNQIGYYDVVITNYLGSVTSTPAYLDVVFIEVAVNGQAAIGTGYALSPATITLSGGFPGGFLFYTTDGTTPTTSSALYTGPFSLTNTATIQTLSLASDFTTTASGDPVTVVIVPTYALQTSVVGSGSVSTNPPGGIYQSNALVTLTATPAAHWAFDHWGGDTNSTQNPLSFTMNSARNIQAVFVAIPTFTLQTSISGAGVLTTNPPGGIYDSNTVVTLTAAPAAHWVFNGWAGDTNTTQNPLTLTMNASRNIQAIFTATAYPLTLSTPGGGSVTANGVSISPSTFYPTNSVVTLAATPSSGWTFLGWTGTVVSTQTPLALTITQTNVIQGVFGTVAATNGLGGAVVLSQPNPIPYGTTLTVSAVADPGNYFATWYGSLSGPTAPQKLGVTSANPSFGAYFGVLPAGRSALSILVNGPGTVSGSVSGSYVTGSTVTLNETPNAGAYFFGWSQAGSGTGNLLTVQMTTNKIVQANFGVGPVVNVTPLNLTVLAGSNATLTATAMGASALAYQWQGSSGIIPGATHSTLTFTNIQPTNAGPYFVVVTNLQGAVTSAVANITVIGAPAITNQPGPVTVVVGHAANFVVGASGWPALAYQWQLDGVNVAGATNSALALSNALPVNAGNYTVAVTNVYGSVTSSPASLTVLPLVINVPPVSGSNPFQLTLDTAIGINYEIEYSTNLLDWYEWFSLSGSGRPITLSDPQNQDRFYRIVLSPAGH
jgi:hypothetical protein